jgi:hypothetical protein
MPNSRSAAHPDYARAAFLGAIREIDLLRSRHRATINMQRLRNAAWAINPRRTLVAQRTTITRFLEAARSAVDSLTRRA